jgi:2-dehydropantoate 2-reductase
MGLNKGPDGKGSFLTDAASETEVEAGRGRDVGQELETWPEAAARRPSTGSPIVIWGAGAMGGSIGAVLTKSGERVLLVDKVREHVQAMNEEGLRITGPVSDFRVSVSASHAGEVRGRFPLVFLCVKAHHTREATAQLRPHLTERGIVVSIQNGLCELDIAEVVGQDRTMGAFVNFGADYLEPGIIHRGNRGAVVVGEIDGAVTKRAEEVFRLLQIFEPDTVLTENIFGFLWGKLSYAALLFATALTDASIADVLEAPAHRPLLVALAREVVDVAGARGVELEGFDGFDPHAFRPDAPAGAPERSLDDLVAFNRASAKTHSGIWRDLAVRKRRTEVDAQLGPVVRLAEEVGVPTPLTPRLIQLIHEIEDGTRGMGWGNLEALTGRG